MTDSSWLTIAEFLARYRLTAKTSRTYIMYRARAGKIPGAMKRFGKWLFNKDILDKWDKSGRRP